MENITEKIAQKLTPFEEELDRFGTKAFGLITNIVIALIVVIIGYRIIAGLERRLKKSHKLSKFDATAKDFIISFAIISLKIVVIIAALQIVGVPLASIITIIGSCAVAIGLALQGGLSNIAGGIMLMIFKPFKVGDYIQASGYEGTVKSISIFYTTITTIDNKVVQLPNGSLSNNSIVNYTANDKRRVDLDIGVDYKTNINKFKDVVRKVIENEELVLHDEEITIRLKEHAASALIFTVRSWTEKQNYWEVYFDLMEKIKEALDKNNISIPFNQLDVHVKK